MRHDLRLIREVGYVTPQPRPELRREAAALAARLGHQCLGKDPGVTDVLAEPAGPEGWFIAGQRPAVDDGKAAFWMNIKVTAGTNTKGETTAFVRSAFGSVAALLGPLHEECYVFVHAVDGDAYGYGGCTQNARWASANSG